MYARIIMTGTPAAGNEKSSESNLTLKVDYRNMDGSPLDVSRLNQGSDFLARVTVYNPSPVNYKDMALTQIFPSGWEIRNTRLHDLQSPGELAFLPIRTSGMIVCLRILTFPKVRARPL